MLLITLSFTSDGKPVKTPPYPVYEEDTGDVIRGFEHVCGMLPGVLKHMQEGLPFQFTVDVVRVLGLIPAKGRQ